MGIWYLSALIIGALLYVKFTFFNRGLPWKSMLSIQLSLIGIGLIIFAIFMFQPMSVKLIDVLF